MRLFIAADTGGELRDELLDTIDDLRSWSLEGSFTDEANLHLTLAFLGDSDRGELPYIKDALIKTVSCLEPPLELTLEGLGFFKGRGRGRTCYRKVRNTKKLQWLAGRLHRELDMREEKPFRPHITLARRCVLYDDFDQGDFEEGLVNVSMEAEHITLYESTLTGGGPVYTPVYRLDL